MLVRNTSWILAAGMLLSVGCTNAARTDTNRSEPTTKVAQPLGEATQAYWFEGNGADAMPNYDERVAWHFINQIRMNTDVFDIRDMDDNLIAPQPPIGHQVGMTEAGRWQGAQSLEYACYCVFDQMSESFVSAAAGSNPYTCCTAGYQNGSIQCVGPIVGCGDDGMMEPADRWGLLNKGPGEIRSEIFWTSTEAEGEFGVAAANWFISNALGSALGERTNAGAAARTSIPIVPQQCQPESTCDGGDCVGPNGETECDPSDPNAPNECIGECDGGAQDGEFCTIPEPLDPQVCDPDNYPRGWYWSFLFGQTSDPIPFLNDVIHAQLDENTAAVLTNYYDPVGEPQLLQVVTDSSCNDMERSFDRPNEGTGGDAGMGADAGADGFEYAGNTYQWAPTDLNDGCIRYTVHAIDSEGFEQTYPTFGSLGMNVVGGAIGRNDESCPVWLPDVRPAPNCLPEVDECTEGATRICYTGRPGTQDKGICGVGTETCVDGRWSGLCEGETRPESTETCGDDEDNNCNGFTEENCPIVVDPGGEEDMGTDPDPVDMGGGNGEVDMGAPMTNGGGGKEEPEGCCTTVDGSPADDGAALIFAGLFGIAAWRRRR